MSIRNQHFAHIDGLRGLAILLVLIYHYGLEYQGHGLFGHFALASLMEMGWMGVDLFFVISGFLITSILLETRDGPSYLKNFIMRRFLRIWPLYYLNLFALIIVAPHFMPSPELNSVVEKQAWFWAYGANWLFALEGGFNRTACGYFWSLAVEEQFYVLWPLVVWKLSEARLRMVCVGMLLGSAALRLALAAWGIPAGSLYTITFTHLDAVAAGTIMCMIARDPRARAAAMRWSTSVLVAMFAALALVRWHDASLKFWEPAMVRYGYTLIAVTGAMLLVKAHFVAQQSWFRRWLGSRFMVLTGRYSYALYLVHVPVGVVCGKIAAEWLSAAPSSAAYDLRFFVQFIAASTVSWLMAMVSWHLLERHILKLKRFFV